MGLVDLGKMEKRWFGLKNSNRFSIVDPKYTLLLKKRLVVNKLTVFKFKKIGEGFREGGYGQKLRKGLSNFKNYKGFGILDPKNP